MATINSDKYGLYLKANGSYYRPVFPVGYKHLEKNINLQNINIGDKIKINKISGSPLIKIIGQFWYAHGQYSDQTSEEAFKPNSEIW